MASAADMPWSVTPDHPSCPASRPWAVVKDSDGEVEGCHPSKAAAQAQQAALYASETNSAGGPVTYPSDNLVRAWTGSNALTVRSTVADDGGEAMPAIAGHFSTVGDWYEIDDWWEGRFLEQVAPGAFTRTFAERGDQIKVLFEHGHDPQVGMKPLGTVTDLREDKIGAAYEVDLLDASYTRDLVPGLAAGLYGSSFRFRIRSEQWTPEPDRSEHNPDGLPERTITDVDVYEFGPVTFPANPSATAGMRSRSAEFAAHLAEPLFVARMTDRLGLGVVEKLLSGLDPDAARLPVSPTDGGAPRNVTRWLAASAAKRP